MIKKDWLFRASALVCVSLLSLATLKWISMAPYVWIGLYFLAISTTGLYFSSSVHSKVLLDNLIAGLLALVGTEFYLWRETVPDISIRIEGTRYPKYVRHKDLGYLPANNSKITYRRFKEDILVAQIEYDLDLTVFLCHFLVTARHVQYSLEALSQKDWGYKRQKPCRIR